MTDQWPKKIMYKDMVITLIKWHDTNYGYRLAANGSKGIGYFTPAAALAGAKKSVDRAIQQASRVG